MEQVTNLEAFAMATIDSGSETSAMRRATFDSRPSMSVATAAFFKTVLSLDSLRPEIKAHQFKTHQFAKDAQSFKNLCCGLTLMQLLNKIIYGK